MLANGLVDAKYNAVGDDAFTNRGHVITPYAGNTLTPQEDAYNYYVSLQRQVVERSFAIWKRKWGIFWGRLQVSQGNVRRIIEVTMRLHNLCIDRSVSHNIDDYIVHNDDFWEKVTPKPIHNPRILAESENRDPVMLDPRERAAMLPGNVSALPAEYMKRKELCDSIACQGLTRPVALPLDLLFPREARYVFVVNLCIFFGCNLAVHISGKWFAQSARPSTPKPQACTSTLMMQVRALVRRVTCDV